MIKKKKYYRLCPKCGHRSFRNGKVKGRRRYLCLNLSVKHPKPFQPFRFSVERPKSNAILPEVKKAAIYFYENLHRNNAVPIRQLTEQFKKELGFNISVISMWKFIKEYKIKQQAIQAKREQNAKSGRPIRNEKPL